ncbi:lanthionine synthetase C family protein [Streptomyces sioyaensis]|uniref:lanthionine synthetase C family protein n=1 Tax=Streptomyces sioyaensis TaxID=67364 RepID=UPI0037CDBF2D
MATVDDVEAQLGKSEDHPLVPGWQAPTLSSGFAGIALVHLYVARAASTSHQQSVGRHRAFEFIRAAAHRTDGFRGGPGLWAGSCGLALALADCCRDEPRFGPALARLQVQVAEQVLATRWPREVGKVATFHYDLVHGAAGALIHLCSIEDPAPAVRHATEKIRDYLLWLCRPESGNGVARRWLIDPEFYFPGARFRDTKTLPHGYLDVGMAHGAAGVLTALATAWRAGYRCRGHHGAIVGVASWILEVRERFDRDGHWPAFVPLTAAGTEGIGIGGNQLEWCYGSMGVAAALLRAAEATEDRTVKRAALDAFDLALRRSASTEGSLSLCHGLAGMLAGCREFAEAGSQAARDALPVLAERLLGHADKALPFLYHDPRMPDETVADLSLLNGAPGMALSLLSAAGGARPAWFSAVFGR